MESLSLLSEKLGNPAAYDNSLNQQEESCQSVREKHPTEKGLEHTRNLRLQAVISVKRSRRKQSNLIHWLLVTRGKDIVTLAAGCEDLDRNMMQFSKLHKALDAVIKDEERKLMYKD